MKRFKRSVLWFRLWLAFRGPKPRLCEPCLAFKHRPNRWHRPCFNVYCTCRCSQVGTN